MKKLFFVLAALALCTSVYALDDDKLTGGFGVGFGGMFFTNSFESNSKSIDLTANGADFLDIEGRLIFNKSNVAVMGRFALGVGFSTNKDLWTTNDTIPTMNMGFYLGAGYRLKFGERFHLIPSLVFGMNYMNGYFSIKTDFLGIADETKITNVCAAPVLGGDVAAIFRAGRHFSLMASCLLTFNLPGQVESKLETTKNNTTSTTTKTFDTKAGGVNFIPKVGFFWLF